MDVWQWPKEDGAAPHSESRLGTPFRRISPISRPIRPFLSGSAPTGPSFQEMNP